MFSRVSSLISSTGLILQLLCCLAHRRPGAGPKVPVSRPLLLFALPPFPGRPAVQVRPNFARTTAAPAAPDG